MAKRKEGNIYIGGDASVDNSTFNKTVINHNDNSSRESSVSVDLGGISVSLAGPDASPEAKQEIESKLVPALRDLNKLVEKLGDSDALEFLREFAGELQAVPIRISKLKARFKSLTEIIAELSDSSTVRTLKKTILAGLGLLAGN